MNLPKHILTHIKKTQIIRPGMKVILGVSGGADSIALLTLLNNLRHELGLELIVAHYNHNVRKGNDSDEKFVRSFAEQLNLRIYVEKWKNPQKTQKGSFEEHARLKRITFFKKLINKTKFDCIVLAHTQDDLAETVLMRLLRGSGLQGLRGILPVRTIEGITFVRPLLKVQKSELLDYLDQHKIPFRKDPTNTKNDFFRNKIRNKLIPFIKEDFNPKFPETLIQFSQQAEMAYDYINLQATKQSNKILKKKNSQKFYINIKKLCNLHTTLQNMILRKGIENVSGDLNQLTHRHIEEIKDLVNHRPVGSQVHLPKKVIIRLTRQNLVIEMNK